MSDSISMPRCITCKWFEPRSGFCRFDPPSPISIPDKTGFHLMSAFPKIPAPNLDYCSRHEKLDGGTTQLNG